MLGVALAGGRTMEWCDTYSVGIVEIDNQHKLLLQSFSLIETAIQLDRGWSSVYYGVAELRELARQHFDFEEGLQRLFAYPHATAHRREHEQFFARLTAIERSCLQNCAESEVLALLRSWLMEHILGTDRDYARYICEGAAIVKTSTNRLLPESLATFPDTPDTSAECAECPPPTLSRITPRTSSLPASPS